MTGKAWPVLPGLVAALLLAAAAYQGRKRTTGTGTAQDGMEQVSALVHAASDKTGITAATARPPIIKQLTKREQDIAALLVNGYETKDAAKSLGMTENTLRWHIKNLHKKTGAADRAELITLLKNPDAVRG